MLIENTALSHERHAIPEALKPPAQDEKARRKSSKAEEKVLHVVLGLLVTVALPLSPS